MKLGQRIKSESYEWFSVVGMAEYPLCEIEQWKLERKKDESN